MNNCMFTGNLGQENELKTTQSGKSLLKNSLAVKANYGEGTNWIPLVLWGKTAEVMAQYTGKGSKVAVMGEMQEEKWEKDGQKRSKLVLNVNKIEFLDKKADNKQNNEIDLNEFSAIDDMEDIPF